MEITAKVLCDTLPAMSDRERLTTFVCTVPKFLLQELNTHRTLCKNAASSRAIPVSKMRDKATYTPQFWPKNVKGMQAGPSVDEDTARVARGLWDSARKNALDTAEQLAALGIHKEVTNRLLEPFLMVPWVVTGTGTWYRHFFSLRCKADADNAMGYLAYLMARAYVDSVPSANEDHLPFYNGMTDGDLAWDEKILVLAARAARISYANFEGKTDIQDDLRLGNALWDNGHHSPFEHCAFPLSDCYKECSGPHGKAWDTGRETLNGSFAFRSPANVSTSKSIRDIIEEMEPTLKDRGYL